MLKNLVISTAIQWVIFMILPVLTYLIFFKKKFSFPAYLGLKKPKIPSKPYFKRQFLMAFILNVILIIANLFILKNYELGIDDMRLLSYGQSGFSLETILIILIQSILQTSFLEEILFRGFLINALSYKLGFTVANHIQAIIFTLLHVIGMIQMHIATMEIICITAIIYGVSIFFGRLAKATDGSIWYSAIFHGMDNLLAALMLIL